MVLVDTSIWSLALRRRREQLNTRERQLLEELTGLIRAGLAALTGPVRQEILSGVREPNTFDRLRRRLDAFVYLHILSVDYDQAAAFSNKCRASGVTGTPTDLLLCAVAHRVGIALFTTDSDFEHLARMLPIRLHALPA
jgi:predicted nucleic acid-binding protein